MLPPATLNASALNHRAPAARPPRRGCERRGRLRAPTWRPPKETRPTPSAGSLMRAFKSTVLLRRASLGTQLPGAGRGVLSS